MNIKFTILSFIIAILIVSNLYFALKPNDIEFGAFEIESELEAELTLEKTAHNDLKQRVLKGRESAVDMYVDYYFNTLNQTQVSYTDPKGDTYLITKQ